MKPEDIVKKLLDEVYTGNGAGTPPPEPEPQGQPSITIGTIFEALPPGVDEQIIAIMNGTSDTIEMARKLKALLRPHAAALEKVGLIPDYTAYMLVSVAQQMRGLL